MKPSALPTHAECARVVASPVGPLTLMGTTAGLAGLYFGDREPGLPDAESLDAFEAQLAEYFAGERTEFDVVFDTRGTAFQMAVWEQLRALRFGETVSYGEIARRMGNPKAVRAVGLANGQNPVSIIVPCHRVIGADGSLTGFGGGLERKRSLLVHEGALLLA
jgi:methylated-DNA-[protein]-cysteine S-methyltransferase